MDCRRPASRRAKAARFTARYEPEGQAAPAAAGSLAYFLAERYTLFVRGRGGLLYTGDVHHEPWDIQEARADIRTNTIPQAAGIELPDVEPLLHYTPGRLVSTYPVVPVCE